MLFVLAGLEFRIYAVWCDTQTRAA